MTNVMQQSDGNRLRYLSASRLLAAKGALDFSLRSWLRMTGEQCSLQN
jgi:hypothetical protein